MPPRKDYTGQKFGKLTAIEFSYIKYKKTHWLFECECGNKHITSMNSVQQGRCTSCGCYKDEVLKRKRPPSKNRKDYTGQKFGKLTVIEFSYIKYKKTYWKCNCDCGNEKIIIGTSLRNGDTKSCGCIPKRLDLIGQKFGKLTVIEFSHKNNSNVVYWKCNCDCGNVMTTRGSSLKSGGTKTCGCINPNFKHGQIHTRTYISWGGMKQRCINPKATGYKNYGGRGITICERWLGCGGFIHFLKDMGERPEGKSIDRIDNDGNYEPSNCQWATKEEQQNNKRRSKKNKKLDKR